MNPEALKDWFTFAVAVIACVAGVIFWVQSSNNPRFEKLEKEINSIFNRLKNKDFIAKAPKKVVEENKIKIKDMMQNKERLSSSKELIKNLI